MTNLTFPGGRNKKCVLDQVEALLRFANGLLVQTPRANISRDGRRLLFQSSGPFSFSSPLIGELKLNVFNLIPANISSHRNRRRHQSHIKAVRGSSLELLLELVLCLFKAEGLVCQGDLEPSTSFQRGGQ